MRLVIRRDQTRSEAFRSIQKHSQKQPEAARSSQKQPEAARSHQKQPSPSLVAVRPHTIPLDAATTAS